MKPTLYVPAEHDRRACPDCGHMRPATRSEIIEALGIDALIGEVGLRLLRYQREGGTITPEGATTTMLNVFDAALGVDSELV